MTVVESVWLMAIVSLIGAVAQPFVQRSVEPPVHHHRPVSVQTKFDAQQPTIRLVRSSTGDERDFATP